MGPTASGKTDLAVELVRRFPFEIVSVDSVMVYRELEVGSAKPDCAVLSEAPHRLIDIVDPPDVYSAARFRQDALLAIDAIRSAGAIPLLVGGTMFYFQALEQGLSELPAADPALREQIARRAQQLGWPALHAELAAVDPESAARIHPHDPQRLQRALEIHRLTGKTRSQLWARAKPAATMAATKLVLCPLARSELHGRIERRFDSMLEKGLVEEVAGLRSRWPLSPSSPAMRAVGYRQVWQHLDGEFDAPELRRRGVVATRRFAKRQLTWLRAQSDARWMPQQGVALLDRVVRHLADRGVLSVRS
jgi:tRNA dimethylallyltransferase